LKAELLESGAAGQLDIDRMDSLLRSFSALRRIIAQANKAAHLLVSLETKGDAGVKGAEGMKSA